MMFHLRLPEDTTGLLSRTGLKVQIFPTPLFSALTQGDPFQIYGKALRILKLESSRQLTVKDWWS